jgi:uncharacterized protein YjbI with pentapeptide repeats
MKTKNLTPFPFGTKVTSRRPPRPEMTLILRAAYLLIPGQALALPEGPRLGAQGPMSAETYRDDDEERAGECLYPGDFADWKPRAEVMLRGTCHTPLGKPLAECPVRFSVGSWSKILRVVGRRFWSDDLPGAVMSETAPFTTMPVDYAHALGGPGHAANPVGRGVAGHAQTRELPNVEHAGALIRGRRDDPGPAGFGPINPAWPGRAPKVGKEYGARWKKDRAPYYAEDFDWTYFNAAPRDQQIDGYLRGDERIVFQNLHPTAQVFETALPALRIRAFVKDDKARFREVPMNLDTLFADLDEGRLYLTWRGLTAVETDDLKDVLWALVASEDLGAEPLPAAHYRERLEAFEADPLGIKDRVPADLLAKREEMKARQKLRAEGKPVSQHDAPPPDPMTANLRALFDELPVAPANAGELEKNVAAAVANAIAKAPPQVDAKAQIARMANDAGEVLAKPRIQGFSLRPGGPPPARAAKSLQKALDQLEQAKRRARDSGKLPGEAQAELDRLDEQIEAIKNEPFFKTLLDQPAYQDPGPGKDLHAQDYEGRDLHGQDLRGANLRDANLAGANLAGASLAGANLDGAILCGADLAGADLTGADLTLANLTQARAPGAIFRDTKLDRAFLQKADLAGAVFSGARGEATFFPEADLTKADCRGLSLLRGFAKGAILAGADFSEASLVRCLLLEVDAKGATFARALVNRTSFGRSDLTGANLTGVRGERSVWLQSKLHDADFTRAILPRAQFIEASALRARFRRAILTESRAYRASFEEADFTESQLFGMDFSKCALGRARFTGACLYDAKLRQASGAGCDFTGANLERAMMEMEEA